MFLFLDFFPCVRELHFFSIRKQLERTGGQASEPVGKGIVNRCCEALALSETEAGSGTQTTLQTQTTLIAPPNKKMFYRRFRRFPPKKLFGETI